MIRGLRAAQVMQKAVCPEKRAGVDDAVSAIASVTEVQLSGDMSVAKVHISVFSDKQGRDFAMEGLMRLEGCGCCYDARRTVYIAYTQEAMKQFLATTTHWRLVVSPCRYTRKQVAHLMNLRMCPEIRFIRDESFQQAEQVSQVSDAGPEVALLLRFFHT